MLKMHNGQTGAGTIVNMLTARGLINERSEPRALLPPAALVPPAAPDTAHRHSSQYPELED